MIRSNQSKSTTSCPQSSKMTRYVAVIGAGAAGLASARRLREQNFFYDVYEQTKSVGGTWVYDERVGLDEYSNPIHTSMYKNLRTNLPKEVMAFPGYPIKDPDNSYVSAETMLNYLQDCAVAFGVMDQIKFNTKVLQVRPKNNLWEITSKNLETKKIETKIYDAVMVCNGHYHTPNIPLLPGAETFTGKTLHSHDYRHPDLFRNQTVVVLGGGPSGFDIALDITKTAKHVYFSHHCEDKVDTRFPDNLTVKSDVLEISRRTVFFKDGFVEPDVLLYCTGFVYSFPFLHEDCGVQVIDNYVTPLYKHLIATRNPTLCFIGLPFYVCANSMFDLQVRFFLATLNGSFILPSQEEMLEDEKAQMTERRRNGFRLRDSHKMGPLQGEYYEDLAKTAGIQGIAPVMTKLHNESSRRFLEDLRNFRNDRYKIVNTNEFAQIFD